MGTDVFLLFFLGGVLVKCVLLILLPGKVHYLENGKHRKNNSCFRHGGETGQERN